MESVARSVNNNTKQLVEINSKLQEQLNQGGGGDASAANQTLQLAQETIIAGDTTSLNSKITSGNDLTLTSAQQVLIYGEVTSGPETGELHPIHITNAGDVEVEIADYPRGQQTSADSFPVTLSSDGTYSTSAKQDIQSTELIAINTSCGSIDDKISSGNSATVTELQQIGLYAINASNNWQRLQYVPETQGLGVNTLERTPTSTSQTIANGAGATALSNAIDLRGFSRCSIYGNTTNSGDPIEVLISDDDVAYYADPSIFITPNFSGDFALSLDANIAVRYIKVRQIDTLATAFTIVIKSSRR
jgi:hypothetical protein